MSILTISTREKAQKNNTENNGREPAVYTHSTETHAGSASEGVYMESQLQVHLVFLLYENGSRPF